MFFPYATFLLFYSAGTRMSGKNLLKATAVISNVLMLEFVSIPLCRIFTTLCGSTWNTRPDPMSVAIWAVNTSMIESVVVLILYRRELSYYTSCYKVYLWHEDGWRWIFSNVTGALFYCVLILCFKTFTSFSFNTCYSNSSVKLWTKC